MNILDKIVLHKKDELASAKLNHSVETLSKLDLYNRKTISFKSALVKENASGIIAEFKRKSPSKGWIFQDANVSKVISAYQNAEVSAISCLTDNHFFGGSKEDFLMARNAFNGPILRKDFIIDAYQIHESKSMGADVILLIASILTKDEIASFTELAHELGMEVLLEIHGKSEIEKYNEKVDVVGINNRDLTDFSVSLLTSIDLKRKFGQDVVMVSESGLDDVSIVHDLNQYGFHGFLIGEYFMRHEDPGFAAKSFIKELKYKKHAFIQSK